MGIGATIRYLKLLVNTLMKITEVTTSPLTALRESLEQENKTGFLTEDLMTIAKQHLSGEWSEPLSLEESLAVDQMIAEGKLNG